MSAQLALQKTLNEALIESRMRNPAFSLRAFARKLDLSPAALSEILNGKRRVSRKLAERIVDNLGLDPEASKSLLGQFPVRGHDSARLPEAGPDDRTELSMDHFRAISDWYYFAILSLAETSHFQDDPQWIAHRLGVRLQDIETAIPRLERLGMLERDAQGKLRSTGVSYKSSDEIVNLALRKAQGQNLELARKSLEEDPVELRDFTAVTLTLHPSKLPGVKQLVRKFMRDLCEYAETGERDEVYRLCVQMLPLTRSASRPTSRSVSEPASEPKVEPNVLATATPEAGYESVL